MPPPSTIMIVRHAEKPTKENEQHGIRPDGEHDRHSLTVRGWTRAGALVGLFAPQHGEPGAGLLRPDAIYASGHAGDGSRRPVQTVTPLAERLGQDIHSGCGAGQESEVAAELAAHRGAVLVAWQHEAIPKLVGELGAVAPAVPRQWPDDRFDVVWTLTRDGSGWEFGQVPQLLLAGDLPDPIG
jgi:broad specificity phosphatase PhoE